MMTSLESGRNYLESSVILRVTGKELVGRVGTLGMTKIPPANKLATLPIGVPSLKAATYTV